MRFCSPDHLPLLDLLLNSYFFLFLCPLSQIVPLKFFALEKDLLTTNLIMSQNEANVDRTSTSKNSLTPIALRTRQSGIELTYRDAALAGKCKLCPASFGSMERLKVHILNHKPNHKRKKALQAIQEVSRLPQ
ncbi:hypothetical protein NPIL_255671 [Nephila pilipes]|uniref:C2H2-type domain-containing protein n=1 Tax=Nephila pilipes TaxID=299642 RepID=A0A8X6IW82_NEPPI|nr:hypothetical protein NPIL_255671 [Nephila pilipes]